jgi:hypothetical protein
MSDFSELCPLFETGVFSEFTFPTISLSDFSADVNAIQFSTGAVASSCADFTFGRTVIITDAWLRCDAPGDGSGIIHLNRHGSIFGAATIVGTFSSTATVTGHCKHAWIPFTMGDATFNSSDVLGLNMATATASAGAVYTLMIRYKEK